MTEEEIIQQAIRNVLTQDLKDELKKLLLSISAENNEQITKKLNSIQDITDKTRTEVAAIGKDQSDNTIAMNNQASEFRALRKSVDKRDLNLIDKEAQSHKNVIKAVQDAVVDTLPGAVELATEPAKRQRVLKPSKGFFSRLFKKGGENK